MGRYIGPKIRLIRYLGILPGLTKKIPKRLNAPGQHGATKKKNKTQYCYRLLEKQKIRFNYGISEKQLANYVKKAALYRGVTGTILLQLLEMRLDNIVYSFGFTTTIVNARQLVTHGHIYVNERKITFPSFQCHPNDIIRVSLIQTKLSLIKKLPDHLQTIQPLISGKIVSLILRKQIELNINELLIIEFYSNK